MVFSPNFNFSKGLSIFSEIGVLGGQIILSPKVYLPEKSLHFLVYNPVSSLHIFYNPK
jgi:hypothetical protein